MKVASSSLRHNSPRRVTQSTLQQGPIVQLHLKNPASITITRSLIGRLGGTRKAEGSQPCIHGKYQERSHSTLLNDALSTGAIAWNLCIYGQGMFVTKYQRTSGEPKRSLA
jgi:hypothetical protein